jgi:hypothetical protein
MLRLSITPSSMGVLFVLDDLFTIRYVTIPMRKELAFWSII